MRNDKLFTPISIGILSLSLLTMSTGIVSPAQPAILNNYPNVSESLVEQVSAIPSFAMAIFIILSAGFTKRLGSKRTVELGLWLVIFSTMLSICSINIWSLLLSRFLLGAGIGTFNSLAVSLITMLYEGDKQSKLLGWENAFQGIGALFGSLLVSVLLLINWRMTFLIYFISIPILWFFHHKVPNVEGKEAEKNGTVIKKTQKTRKYAIAFSGILTFVLMTSYMLCVVKLPTYLIQNHIGTASTSGILIGIISISTVISGIVYGTVYKKIRFHTLSLACALMMCAFALLGIFNNTFFAICASFLVGISFGFFVPCCFSIANKSVSVDHSDLVTKLMMIANNIANFLAPFTALLLNINSENLGRMFVNGCYVLVFFLVITFITVKVYLNRNFN